MSYRARTITVNGIDVCLDVDVDLSVGDLSGDMDRIAAQMGFAAHVWAAAVEEQINVDAHYRRWRAQQVESILADDPKLAEWKVKAKIEANDMFIKLKAAVAKAESNLVDVAKWFAALDKKSNQLQSKGAMSRSELDATGMHTPAKPRKHPKSVASGNLKEPRDPSEDPRVSAMRDRNRKKNRQ